MKEATFGIFGNYFILDQLARGGMAEIDLARPAVSSANGRILVLKRILPQATQDPEYISMFQSETQVSMGFHHPNLVQIYDFGKVADEHFIAMEYIEGKNLREVSSKYLGLGKTMPIGLTVNVIAQTAAGLEYAHNFRNHVTGESLHIIHRDISPQNILVSYDGNVKIIDFGIAKSESPHADKTRAGCIKGKLSYLSPEQLFQKELDGRSDIFSLGAVLWELLTGHKLFHQQGQNDMEIMESIAHCETSILPPSTFNEQVSPALDAIVMRALAKERNDRFADAEEFQRALNDFLNLEYPGFSPKKVGEAVRSIFKMELEQERQHIKELNHSAQEALQGGELTTQLAAAHHAQRKISHMPALQSRSYTPASVPQFAPALGDVSYTSDSLLPKKVREQFYIKLTFGRALGLLMYAATLLVLRLDHDQMVLNAIFGPWHGGATQSQAIPPVAVASNPVAAAHAPTAENAAAAQMPKNLQSVLPTSDPALAQESSPNVRPMRHAALPPSILLHINLILRSGPAAVGILVNQKPLDLKRPYVQIPSNKKFWVEVLRKGGKSLVKTYQLKSDSVRSPASYDLKLNLY